MTTNYIPSEYVVGAYFYSQTPYRKAYRKNIGIVRCRVDEDFLASTKKTKRYALDWFLHEKKKDFN